MEEAHFLLRVSMNFDRLRIIRGEADTGEHFECRGREIKTPLAVLCRSDIRQSLVVDLDSNERKSPR